MQKFIIKYFYLLIVLLNFSCATIIFSRLGEGIGIIADKSRTKKVCSASEIIQKEIFPLKKNEYRGFASILGLMIDIPIGIGIVASQPATMPKVLGGFIYILGTLGNLIGNNMDSPRRIYYREDSWFPENWADCKNSADFFHSLQGTRINLKQDITLEERKKLCSLETNKLIEKAYLSLAEYNFDKPQKKLLNELKKKLPKPEIFPFESHLSIGKSETGFVLECAHRIIFYYKGGNDKLKEDFLKIQ